MLMLVAVQPKCFKNTYMLVHVLGDAGHIEVGVEVVGELLQLGVEGFLFKMS